MVAVSEDSLIATAIRSYARLIKRRSRLVVAFWLVFLAATAPFAPGIFSATTQEFTPPPSSAAHQANAALQAQFPVAGRATQFVVLLSTRDGSSVLESADARAASDTLEAVARNHSLTHDVAGYYPLLKLGMRPQDLAPSFVSNSSSSTLIELECSTYMTDQPTIDYLHWLEERVDELQAAHGSSLEVDLLGAPLIIEEAADTAMSDLEHMDAIVLPLSFAILAGVIGSFRLLLVPLLTIGVAAAGAFGITALIARATPIFTITPSLMMSILIAMSIDYALFLLTRFRQERLQGRSVPAAVEVTLQTAGMTVLVSGLTLAASFVALLFFPISVISSLGIGCTLALLLVLAVNLSLVPALLLSFPAFFGAREPCCCGPLAALCRRRYADDDSPPPLASLEEGGAAPQGPTLDSAFERLTAATDQGGDRRSALPAPEALSCPQRFWWRLSGLTTRWPLNLLCVAALLGLTVPLGLTATTLATTDGWDQAIPRGSALGAAFERMGREFGAGHLNPYSILLRPRTGSATSRHFFSSVASALAEFEAEPALRVGGGGGAGFEIDSLAYKSGTPVPWLLYETCELVPHRPADGAALEASPPSPSLASLGAKRREALRAAGGLAEQLFAPLAAGGDPLGPLCAGLRYAKRRFLNDDGSAAMAMVVMDVDPLGAEGDAWLHAARDTLARVSVTFDIDASISGVPGDIYDCKDAVFALMPVMVAVMALLVLLLVGCTFGSLVIPLRSVVSIGVTVTWAYGAAVLTYQHGWLEWTGLGGLARTDSQMWLVPVISLPILVGISLDYDIFLLARVAELRGKGATTQQAIRHGVTSTGSIISSAGLIMAIAFSGLLFSANPTLDMVAFYLVFAVLADTFVMRPLLVPAAMALLGEANWWPQAPTQRAAKPPAETAGVAPLRCSAAGAAAPPVLAAAPGR